MIPLKRCNNTYRLEATLSKKQSHQSFASVLKSKPSKAKLLTKRFMGIGPARIHSAKMNDNLRVELAELQQVELPAKTIGAAKRKTFHRQSHQKANAYLQRVHTDTLGKYPKSIHGNYYMRIFVDEHTGVMYAAASKTLRANDNGGG